MAEKAKGDSVFAERTITNIMKAEFAGQMVVVDTKPHYNIRQVFVFCFYCFFFVSGRNPATTPRSGR